MTFTKKLITKIWPVSLIVEWKLALMLWVSMLWLLNLCTLQFKCFVEKKCRFQTLIFVNEEMKPIWLMCLISHLLNLDINNMDQKTHWFQLNGNYSFNLIKFFFSFGEQSILWKDMSRCLLIVILNGFYIIVLLLPSVAKNFENHLPMLRVGLIAIHSIFYFCKKNLLV